jgi:peptide deformylase
MPILYTPNTQLRLKSKSIKKQDINSDVVNNIINKLTIALQKTKVGVALSAPQIGYLVRIFIVSNKVFQKKNIELFINNKQIDVNILNSMIFINPRIIKISNDKETLEESCLSVKNTCGTIQRSKTIILTAYNTNGIFTIKAYGLLSQIIQHEMDHLNGILFTDKADTITKCGLTAKLQTKSRIIFYK